MRHLFLFLLCWMVSAQAPKKYYKYIESDKILNEQQLEKFLQLFVEDSKASQPKIDIRKNPKDSIEYFKNHRLVLKKIRKAKDSLVYEFDLQGSGIAFPKKEREAFQKYLNDIQYPPDFWDKPLPAFQLKDEKNKTITNKNLIGKPTLLILRDTLNSFLNDRYPHVLNRLKKKYGKKLNIMVMFSYDSKKLKELQKKYPYPFPHVLEAKDWIKQFNTIQFPSFLLLESDTTVYQFFSNWAFTVKDSAKGYSMNNLDLMENFLDKDIEQLLKLEGINL